MRPTPRPRAPGALLRRAVGSAAVVRLAVGAAVLALVVGAVPTVAAESTVTVEATTDAALVPPMVSFRIGDGHGRARVASDDDPLADLPALAVLDTGASTHLLSHDSAERFGVRTDSGARWVETGMGGEHALAVSVPTTITVEAGVPLTLAAQRLLVNDVPASPDAMLANPGAIVDVIGMPAIEHAIVELRLGGGALGIPEVALLAPGATVRAEHWIALAFVDFNHRHHPRNRGTPPTATTNPVLRGVRVAHAGRDSSGDWLLDTGSAVTIVSTTTARALGLTQPAPLSAPVGGISGGEQALPGWRVERIELPMSDGGVIAVRDAAVFVHDVTTTGDDGSRTTLDGIVGINLLAAFARAVIDVPHGRLGLDVAPATGDVRTPRSPHR